MKTLWLFIVACVALLCGCGDPVVQQGHADYQRYCGSCHGGLDGVKPMARAPKLLQANFLRAASDEFIFAATAKGRGGTPMAAFGQAFKGPLSDSAIRGIIQYLRTVQTLEPLALDLDPTPPTVAADVEVGRQLFAQGCAWCHGAAGVGSKSAPSLDRKTFTGTVSAAYVRDAIENGRAGTSMPGYAGRLEETAIDALIAYILTINTEEKR